MQKLVVIGMNNPQSADPARALFPDPPGCAGHRLWQMATARTNISMERWLQVTELVNLVNATEWDEEAARQRAPELIARYAKSTVVLLGNEVARHMRVRCAPALGWALPSVEFPERRDWCVIPHPSGLNREYNNEVIRAAVEFRLADLLHQLGHDMTALGHARPEDVLVMADPLPQAHFENPRGYWHATPARTLDV